MCVEWEADSEDAGDDGAGRSLICFLNPSRPLQASSRCSVDLHSQGKLFWPGHTRRPHTLIITPQVGHTDDSASVRNKQNWSSERERGT